MKSDYLSWNELPEPLREAAKPARAAVHAGRSVLLIGPPGAGKTMIGRRLALDAKRRSEAEHLDIYRMAGLTPSTVSAAPFRAPHHTVSVVGMTGSAKRFRPGELSLAHTGILFLDELSEFQRPVLAAVRVAHREKKVVFGPPDRYHLVSLPTDFVLVGATNLCPCGNRGVPRQKCSCDESAVRRYHKRYESLLSFDVTVELPVLAAQSWRELR